VRGWNWHCRCRPKIYRRDASGPVSRDGYDWLAVRAASRGNAAIITSFPSLSLKTDDFASLTWNIIRLKFWHIVYILFRQFYSSNVDFMSFRFVSSLVYMRTIYIYTTVGPTHSCQPCSQWNRSSSPHRNCCTWSSAYDLMALFVWGKLQHRGARRRHLSFSSLTWQSLHRSW